MTPRIGPVPRTTTNLARSFPAVEVVPDTVFVDDGDLFTSAGMAAGIDLALAFVQHDLRSHRSQLARRGDPKAVSLGALPIQVVASN